MRGLAFLMDQGRSESILHRGCVTPFGSYEKAHSGSRSYLHWINVKDNGFRLSDACP